MGLAKKMDWLKWIRKYSGILQDTKTGSMETLIDSASSKTINYAYTSSVIADDESINAAAPPHQRPMLPPPNTSQESPTLPQLPNDVYDCCVSLDGIPIKHEFQYTLSNINGCGKVAKHDIEGLASKILESMYGTTLNTSPRGQRTVKVTLNIRQSTGVQVDCTTATMTPSWSHHNGRERKHKSSSDRRHHARARILAEPEPNESDCLIYGFNGSPMHYKLKSGAEIYRRDQLVEMVEKSLAENLSFQNLREAQSRPEGYHRTRTRRRQSSASAGGALQQQYVAAVPSPAAKPTKPPPKVAWSPYDYEPVVAKVPSHYHHQHHHHNQHQHQHQYQHEQRHHRHHKSQQRALYGKGGGGGGGPPVRAAVAVEEHVVKALNGGRPQRRAAATTAAVVSSDRHQQKPKNLAAATATTAAQEHTKNLDHQRYKRAKLASKKIHHHIHEHHHYHHYDYYIV